MIKKGLSDKVKSSGLLDEKTFYYYVLSCMIIMPLAELVSEFFGVVYYSQPAILSVYGILGFCLCVLRILYDVKQKDFKWQDVFFCTLFILSMISLIFSTTKPGVEESIYNSELPTHFMAYYSLMYASFQINDKKRRKMLIIAFVGLAFVEGIIGILQTFEIKIQEVLFETTTTQVYGLTENTNFFGGLSVLFFGATLSAFVFAEKRKYKVIFAFFFAITYYCSFNSMARLAWVGDIAIVLFLLVSILIMKKLKKDAENYHGFLVSWLIAIILIIAVTGISFAKSDLPSERISQSVSELESGDFNEFGTARGYIWKYAFESVPKHWTTGIGLDNFRMVFHENPSWHEGDYSRGKAHNEYIHTLATQGIFALLNYLVLLVLSAVKAIKRIIHTEDRMERILTWTVLAMFVGYAVSAMFNSSVINVAMYFWIVIGLLNPREEMGGEKAA